MKPLIYYYCLDVSSVQEASIEVSLRELGVLLKRPPVEANCPIVPLPDNLQGQIAQDLKHPDLRMCAGNILKTLECWVESSATKYPSPGLAPKLLVCCSRQHPLTKRCLATLPTALWGLTINDCLAVIYELSMPLVLGHESLHLVGADDCYDLPNRGPTCEHRQCIMQYAPTEGIVDGHLALCSDNAKCIKGRFANTKD